MNSRIKLLGLLFLTVFLVQCGDSEFWKYFMKGALLTTIHNAKTEIDLDERPRSVYCFDKDLDGDQDMFVICDNNLVYEFTNLVGGRFGTPAPAYIVEETPQRMAVADFNDDRLLDMAISNQTSDDVAVLFNSHSGDFSNMIYMPSGGEPFPILASDLNDDYYEDLIVGSMVDNTVQFFRNFEGQELKLVKEKKVGDTPFGLAASDLDKNGYPDILCINYESNDLSVLKNSGDFYFKDEEVYPIPGNPSAIATLDFNGDSFYDVAITQFTLDSMIVLFNNGKGEFSEAASFATGVSPISMVAMDFDMNGWEDLVVANKDEDSLSFYLNSPEYLDQFKYALPAGFSASFITLGILNDNQFYDFVVCDFDNRKLLIIFDIFAPQTL